MDEKNVKGALYFLYLKKNSNLSKVLSEHYDRALLSIKTLQAKMPFMKAALFTNINPDLLYEKEIFNDIFVVDKPIENIWVFKYYSLMNTPYNITLHLDMDTYIVEDFSEVFEVLEKFDIVMPLSPHYISHGIGGVPKCFPEFAGGWILYKKDNKKVMKVFEEVEKGVKIDGRTDEHHLRKCIYHSNVRYAIIPWEYNCVFLVPGYLFSKVKVMHGPSLDIEEDIRIMNIAKDRRIYSGETLFTLKTDRKIRKKYVKISEAYNYGHTRW